MFEFFKDKIKNYLYKALVSNDHDKKNEHSNHMNNECPEENAGLISKLAFSWNFKMLYQGYFKGPLGISDLPNLPKSTNVINTSKHFENIDFKHTRFPLIKQIVNKFVFNNKKSILLLILSTVVTIISPLILKDFIKYIQIEGGDKSILNGIFKCCLLFISSLTSTITIQYSYWYGMKNNIDVKGGLISKIYEKALKLSASSKGKYNVGSILNLMMCDVEIVSSFFWLDHVLMFLVPIQIISSLGILCSIIGWTGIIGFLIMVLSILPSTVLGSRMKVNLEQSLKHSDTRSNLQVEFISGIRFLKMLAWDNYFINKVLGVRELQLKYLYNRNKYWILDKMLSQSTNALVLVTTFILYSMLGNTITLDIAFPSITIFISLRLPLIMFKQIIHKLSSLLSSSKRIEHYLQSIEVNNTGIGGISKSDGNVEISNVTFKWEGEKYDILNNINFKAPKSKLTIICGMVATGKTSLLYGLMGEISNVGGDIKIPSSVSFSTQKPFLIGSTTIRDNILFGNEMNINRYKQVLESCCLKPDLQLMVDKDQFQVGQHGDNLSVGQKQRISIARTIYSDSDCYLFDDPLSSLDNKVANHIFSNVFQGSSSILQNKTKILVTHQIQYISLADHIVVIDSNHKITQGTYSELIEQGIDFESIIKTTNADNVEQQTVESNIDVSTCTSEPIEQSGSSLLEERNGNVGIKVYKEYFKNGSSIKMCIVTCVIYFIGQLLFVMSDYWLTEWAGQTSLYGDEQEYNIYYIKYYLLIFSMFIVILFVDNYMLSKITFTASKNLYEKMLKSIGFASVQFFDNNTTGTILNRFTNDINDIDLQLLRLFDGILYCSSNVLVGICLIIYALPISVLPFLILLMVYYTIQLVYQSSSKELQRLESVTRSPIITLLSESLDGLITIRSFKQQSRFIKMMNDHLNLNLRCYYYSFSIQIWMSVFVELLSSLVVLIISISSLFNSSGSGLPVLAVTTSIGLTSYLNYIILQYTQLSVKMNSVERILDYISIKNEHNQYNTFITSDQQDIINTTQGDGLELEFKNVEIKYKSNGPSSLKNVSFKCNSNEKILIVGRTGAGKSTIGQSIYRMVNCYNGSILINGIDINEIGLNTLRNSFLSIVPQESFIFNDTILSNIDPLNQYTTNEIWDVLNKVDLKNSIESMPAGLSTIIQNGDSNCILSYGQKQLLSISRVLLKKPRLLILDECTSNLDYQTSQKLYETILNNCKNCTILSISHRQDTFSNCCDTIFVIDKGKLIEIKQK